MSDDERDAAIAKLAEYLASLMHAVYCGRDHNRSTVGIEEVFAISKQFAKPTDANCTDDDTGR